MNNWTIVLFCVADAVVVSFIVGTLVRGAWTSIANRFPEQSIGDGALRKRFQSIAIGSLNLGFSVHMAADDDYLHWIPTRLLRIFGCGTLSIPWSAIFLASKQPTFQKSISNVCLTVPNSQVIAIPRWYWEIRNTVAPTEL